MPLGREDAVILVVRIDGRAKIKKSAVYRKQVNNEKKRYLRKGRRSNYACGIMAVTLPSKD